MKIEQFVMAYSVEQDRIRAMLPEGYESIRPVFRLNAEVRGEAQNVAYIEFNTAVEANGKRGWLNIGHWDSEKGFVKFVRDRKKVTFTTDFLEISFTGVGMEGNCPAEKDNEGCFFIEEETYLRLAETICVKKEFCDCEFVWKFHDTDAYGVSIGKTLPAIPTPHKITYEKQEFSKENAASIRCEQVLGAYKVMFERNVI